MAKICLFAILVVLSVVLPKTKGQTYANRPCYKSTAPAGVTCTGLRNLKFISKYYLANLFISKPYQYLSQLTVTFENIFIVCFSTT